MSNDDHVSSRRRETHGESFNPPSSSSDGPAWTRVVTFALFCGTIITVVWIIWG